MSCLPYLSIPRVINDQKKLKSLLLLCIGLVAISGCTPQHRGGETAATTIRGIYWFGKGWPPNFWTTDVLSTADEDFRRMKSDGFDTVFLVVPWEGFVNPSTGEVSLSHFEKLDLVIAKAKAVHLRVGLRLAYYHNIGYANYANNLKLFTSSQVYTAWPAFMREIGRRYNADEAVVEKLISWEDLWSITSVSSSPLPKRLAFSKDSGFQDFLAHRMSLTDVSRDLKADFSSWRSVPIPPRDSPAFRLVLDYLKDAFQKRFYEPAAAVVAGLSFELRVDGDPIFDGSRIIGGYDWSDTWKSLSPKGAVVYFNPYYGADNTGHAISPKQALAELNMLLTRLREKVGSTPIFIDQFNLRDETPGFRNDYVSDADLPDFLKLSTTAIRTTRGYAFWFFRGYYHNVLSNPDFSQGLDDWQTNGKVELHGGSVELFSEASLARSFKNSEYLVEAHPLTVCVTMQGVGAGSGLKISGNAATTLYDVPASPDAAAASCKTVPGQTELKFTSYGSGVDISMIKLFTFYQKGSIYNVDGSSGVLLDATRSFNHQVFDKETASR